MEVFNVIVGIATILGAIAAIVSAIKLQSISNQINNSGENNSSSVQQNIGKNNQNSQTTFNVANNDDVN